MGIFDFFKRAPSITPEQAREYIQGRRSDEYCLLDVRQPAEYAQGHLPGARLVPMAELAGKLKAMDRERTTIVYCRSGNRSLSAASLLLSAGFREVLNMEGGILRYQGAVASGPPEAGMFCFPETLSPGQLTAVAWFLEEGTLAFLDAVRKGPLAGSMSGLLVGLMTERGRHKERLLSLYSEMTGETPPVDFPRGVIEVPAEKVMVGCVKVSDAVRWAGGKSDRDILELMISLSANACDLYLKLGRAVQAEEARGVFNLLAGEEQRNIERVSAAYERALS